MLRVMIIGMGPIGIAAAAAVAADDGFKLAGLVDADPKKIGSRSVSGGPAIVAAIGEIVADVAIVTTTSSFEKNAPLLRELIARRIHVVSSCEEMSWPRYRHPELAKQIDHEAKQAGVALLGTGVNPGFVMDYLPLVLSSMTTHVSAVKVIRRVDAGTRRRPLQKKVGATMSVENFRDLARQSKIGHQGIAESVAMLAAGLGREVAGGAVKVTLDPVIAEKAIQSSLGEIHVGQVCGMRNTANWQDKVLSIALDLTMAVGTRDPHDSIELSGAAPLKLRIEGGTPGDSATVASLVNFARVLPSCSPGLKTMLDVPVGSARS